jgi:RecJ-like exonuclease
MFMSAGLATSLEDQSSYTISFVCPLCKAYGKDEKQFAVLTLLEEVFGSAEVSCEHCKEKGYLNVKAYYITCIDCKARAFPTCCSICPSILPTCNNCHNGTDYVNCLH